MLSRVIAKNIGMFFETQCSSHTMHTAVMQNKKLKVKMVRRWGIAMENDWGDTRTKNALEVKLDTCLHLLFYLQQRSSS